MRIPNFTVLLPDSLLALPVSELSGKIVELRGSEFHHLHHVLRMRVGDRLNLFDRKSSRYCSCVLHSIDESSANVKITHLLVESSEPTQTNVNLLVGSIKPAKCDFIIEKAVELGLTSVHFFAAQRTQNSKRTQTDSRSARYDRIIEAALKQSAAKNIPKVVTHNSLKEMLGSLHLKTSSVTANQEIKIVLLTQPADKKNTPTLIPPLAEVFKQLTENSALSLSTWSLSTWSLSTHPTQLNCYLLIGPEGGFTDEEVRDSIDLGYFPASLGPNTLRSETAAVIASGFLTLAKTL